LIALFARLPVGTRATAVTQTRVLDRCDAWRWRVFLVPRLVDAQDTLNVSVRAYPTAKSPIAVNIGLFDETKFRVTCLITIDQARQLIELLRTGINKAKLSGRMGCPPDAPGQRTGTPKHIRSHRGNIQSDRDD
jgi:hypothetical protein